MKYKILSGSALKVIALVSMVVDHTTKAAVAVWPWMRHVLFTIGGVKITPAFIGVYVIGRIAFPLFAFLCVEGVKHTRDIRKYMSGLLLFAVLSIVPFNLMRGLPWYDMHKMNVLFTLFLGVLGIYCLNIGIHNESNCDVRRKNHNLILAAAGVLFSLAAAYVMKCDYSISGVALIILMYLLDRPGYQCLSVLAVLGQTKATFCAAFASVPILLYNGERGFIKGKAWKYAFYAFYPLHMLVITSIFAT